MSGRQERLILGRVVQFPHGNEELATNTLKSCSLFFIEYAESSANVGCVHARHALKLAEAERCEANNGAPGVVRVTAFIEQTSRNESINQATYRALGNQDIRI